LPVLRKCGEERWKREREKDKEKMGTGFLPDLRTLD
jgi:hypothetical protein